MAPNRVPMQIAVSSPADDYRRSSVELVRKCLILKRHWKLIVTATFAAMTIVALYQVFIAGKRYRAYAVVIPAARAQRIGGQAGAMSDMSDVAGFLSDDIALTADRYLATMNSYDFTMALADRLHLGARLIARDGRDPAKLTGWQIYRRINRGFASGYDYDASKLTLYYVDSDPALAKEILSAYIAELRERMEAGQLAGSSAAIGALQEQMSYVSDPQIQERLYKLMAAQIERRTLAPLSAEFALKVVEPPVVPNQWYSPNMFLSLLWTGLATGLALCSYFLLRARLPRKSRAHERPSSTAFYEMVARPVVSAPAARRVRHVVVFGAGLAALNLMGPGRATAEQAILASAILAVCALPVLAWLWGFERGIPFMPFICMLYAIYFALPMLLLEKYSYSITESDISDAQVTKALALVVIGLVCMLIGYYGPQRTLLRQAMPKFSLSWRNQSSLKLLGLAFSFGGLAIFPLDQLVKFPKSMQQLLAFGGEFALVGACVLFALQMIGRLDGTTRLLLWAVIVPGRVLLGFGKGATYSGFIAVLTLVYLYATMTRSLPWKTLLVGLIAVMLVRPAMAPFRMLTWRGGSKEKASPIERVALFAQTAERLLKSGAAYDSLFQFTLHRLAYTLALAEVARDTPDHVPYWRGVTLYPLLFKPIPRPLWPDKPEINTGQELGHRYGLLGYGDSQTTINLPQLVEQYANFGVIGLVLGMFLYGVVYRLYVDALVHPRMGFGAIIAVVFMTSRFFNIESDTYLIFGGALWSILFIAIVHLLVDAAELNAPGRPARSSVAATALVS